MNDAALTAGVARIKSEFLVHDHVKSLDLVYVSQSDQRQLQKQNGEEENEPAKKRLKGQNKHRPGINREPRSSKLCPFVIGEDICPYEKCYYSHDVNAYLTKKQPDVDRKCHLSDTFGWCPYGPTCRFLSSHSATGKDALKPSLKEFRNVSCHVRNHLTKELQHKLRKRAYDFSKSEIALKASSSSREDPTKANHLNVCKITYDAIVTSKSGHMDVATTKIDSDHTSDSIVNDILVGSCEDGIRLRPEEIKQVDQC